MDNHGLTRFKLFRESHSILRIISFNFMYLFKGIEKLRSVLINHVLVEKNPNLGENGMAFEKTQTNE